MEFCVPYHGFKLNNSILFYYNFFLLSEESTHKNRSCHDQKAKYNNIESPPRTQNDLHKPDFSAD